MSALARSKGASDCITLQVPFRTVKRGGRKEMRLPEGAAHAGGPDSTLVKALARAFRWKRMLESGEFATVTELAKQEGLTLSFVTRVLRLTLLAPEIVDAILDGKEGQWVTLASTMKPFPLEWVAQTTSP
jgi:hypothetical protein